MNRLSRFAALAMLISLVGPIHLQAQSPKVKAPIFEVDPYWQQPLPNHWITGSVIGLFVDDKDQVWILHRLNTIENNFKAGDLNVGACCFTAPPVLVYDKNGNPVKFRGGPGEGYHWPDMEHGITVDHKGNVWIGANGMKDSQVLKFTNDGKFLMQVGKYDAPHNSNDPENVWRAAQINEDAAANEMFIADGYGNRRVVVIDSDTGKFKRYWGAYGNKPEDPPPPPPGERAGGGEDTGPKYDPNSLPSKQFNVVHCSRISNDGLVYVCDRKNDRIQVFHKDGSFVKEAFIEPKTLRSGSVWNIAFSKDPQQTLMYVANGVNEKIYVIRRSTLEIVTTFGNRGRAPGEFFGCHNLAGGFQRQSVCDRDLLRCSYPEVRLQGGWPGRQRPGCCLAEEAVTC